MSKMPNHRSRFRSLRRVLRWLVVFEVLTSMCLVVVLVTRHRITIPVTIACVAAALVLVLLAFGLRIGFRNLPELERMATTFDEEAAAQKDGQTQGPE